MAEEDLQHAAEVVAILWLNKLADHRHIERPHQI